MRIGDKVIAYAMDMMVEGVIIGGVDIISGHPTILPGAEIVPDGTMQVEEEDRTVTINGWHWTIVVEEGGALT